MAQPSEQPILKSESDASDSEVHRGERVESTLSLRTGGSAGSSWSAINSAETPFRKRQHLLEEELGENPMPIFGSINFDPRIGRQNGRYSAGTRKLLRSAGHSWGKTFAFLCCL